ncbi:MAG: hypothetical protein WA851_11840 [Xanthobacteraceae bacterium]
MDLTDVFGVQVHIGEAITGDMPQAGDGGGGIAGDRAASSLIGKNAASKACATARFRVAVGRCGSRIVIPKVMTLARASPPNPAPSNANIANLRDLLRRQ